MATAFGGNMRNVKTLVFVSLLLSACSSTGIKRVSVEESPSKPSWVNEEHLSWEEGDKVYFKAKNTVRGDQRLNGCYVIASNDNRETMLRGIADEMKGATDEAQTDISEAAEIVLGKVRSGEWNGRFYGFRDESQYFERYQIRDTESKQVTERIDCYTLSVVSKTDYARTKSEVANKIVAIDPKIKEAITKKQVNFFENRKPTSLNTKPGLSESAKPVEAE
jgi:hypothetical protein